MKPEIKTVLSANTAAQRRSLPADHPMVMARSTFLSALHWREDELWCGPFYFGRTHYSDRFDGWFLDSEVSEECFETKPKARAALEAAAKTQIEAWFKEQSE